jgi:hypothetical protein
MTESHLAEYLIQGVTEDGRTFGCVAVRREGQVNPISKGYLMVFFSATRRQTICPTH